MGKEAQTQKSEPRQLCPFSPLALVLGSTPVPPYLMDQVGSVEVCMWHRQHLGRWSGMQGGEVIWNSQGGALIAEKFSQLGCFHREGDLVREFSELECWQEG